MSSVIAAGRVPRRRRLKRSTRRRLVNGGLYAVFVVLVVLAVLLGNWHAVQQNFFDGAVWKDQFPEIITTGARNTITYTAAAFACGFALAVVLALMKLAPVAPYRWLATSYIEFFRGLPALVVIFCVAFAVPIAFNGWRPPGGTAGQGVLALTLVYAAYMAETLRAGIQAVPKGQNEAARSLGMSAPRTMVSITLPQAFRIVIPPLTNEFVALLKDTSLLSVIGFAVSERELTSLASDNLNSSANSSPLIAAAVVYLVITLPLTQLVAWLERRGQRGR